MKKPSKQSNRDSNDIVYNADEMDKYLKSLKIEKSEVKLNAHIHSETLLWVRIHLPKSNMTLDIMKKDINANS